MRTYGIFARSSDPSQPAALISTSRSFNFAFSLAREIETRTLSTLSGNRALSEAFGLSDIMDVYSMPIGAAYCMPEVSFFDAIVAL